MSYTLHHADCLEWLDDQPENSFEAIVTDPPYGLKEFTDKEKSKLRNGNKGGIWRIPPTLNGSTRAPLPRFTVLTKRDLEDLDSFFLLWGRKVLRIAVPGAHLMIATNPFLSDLLYAALRAAGWEKRGEVVRLVQTLKGGDRPKNAEEEFPGVTVMPRSAWEPWGIFRKPLDGRVQDSLRRWNTGGLRRESDDRPFTDVIPSERTPRQERKIADHPSLKPQRFMRQIVCAALPLRAGRILDPFMGAGSTIAAAEAVGYEAVGVELDEHYYAIAEKAIPQLAQLYPKQDTGSKAAQAPAVMFGWEGGDQTHDTGPTEIVAQESLFD
jgi:site-specific DNA-methyltransferase (adenine-specific)